MSKIFVIADTHFGDDNIRKFENRPFDTVIQMTRGLVERWNETVSEEDTVYVLGDFCVESEIKNVLADKKLNGKIILIVGNHDKGLEDTYRKYGVEVIEYPIVIDGFWILSHEPMYVSEQSPYANVFGHVHNNPMYKTVSSRSYCVSVERIGYRPIELEKVKREVLANNK